MQKKNGLAIYIINLVINDDVSICILVIWNF